MLAHFLLGLLGSFGHCVGMCSGMVLLFQRQSRFATWWTWALAQIGRMTTYVLLGLVVGSLVEGLGVRQLILWQGGAALFFAALAFYLSFALFGLAPMPERLLSPLMLPWRRAMTRLREANGWPLLFGMFWGFLPCGLVWSALLLSLEAPSPWQVGLRMGAFGLGTLPMAFTLQEAGRRGSRHAWAQPLIAGLMLFFGFQFAMRGFAALGWLPHFHLGPLMLW